MSFFKLYNPSDVNWEWLYNGRGTGIHREFSIYRPSPPTGYKSVSDVVVPFGGSQRPSNENYNRKIVFVKDTPLVAKPSTDYTFLWNDGGSGGSYDGAIWLPRCSDNNYIPIGITGAQTCNYTKPSIGIHYCVNKMFLNSRKSAAKFIANDSGSGARHSVEFVTSSKYHTALPKHFDGNKSEMNYYDLLEDGDLLDCCSGSNDVKCSNIETSRSLCGVFNKRYCDIGSFNESSPKKDYCRRIANDDTKYDAIVEKFCEKNPLDKFCSCRTSQIAKALENSNAPQHIIDKIKSNPWCYNETCANFGHKTQLQKQRLTTACPSDISQTCKLSLMNVHTGANVSNVKCHQEATQETKTTQVNQPTQQETQNGFTENQKKTIMIGGVVGVSLLVVAMVIMMD